MLARVGQKLAQAPPIIVSTSNGYGANSVELGRHLPHLAEFCQIWAGFGHVRADFGQSWPGNRPTLVELPRCGPI